MIQEKKIAYNTILLFGPPGSGKGTWGKIIGMLPDFYHLSTGDLFRMINTKSDLGKKVMEFMKAGELVPDQIVFDLFKHHMDNAVHVGQFDPHSDVLILDGFPRTMQQARMLDGVANIKVIFLLDCDDREVLLERLRRRAVLEGRADDAGEAVLERRFEIYQDEILRTLEYLDSQLIEKVDVAKEPVNILFQIGDILVKKMSS